MNEGLVRGDEVPAEYVALVQPHVDSFDYFLQDGMQLAVDSMEPLEVRYELKGEMTVASHTNTPWPPSLRRHTTPSISPKHVAVPYHELAP